MPKKVLVIDDEGGTSGFLQEALPNRGYSVTTASNGVEGLQKFQQDNFDVVLTDLTMPKMDGWEVARRIKKVSPRTPVILMSGKLPESNPEGLFAGTITKPFTLDEIIQTIKKALS